MQHLPLFADLKHRAIVVVGGGIVAERRVTLLLEADAAVTVIAPELTERLAELMADGRFTHVPRSSPACTRWSRPADCGDRRGGGWRRR
jgi:siroheme synthase-like protein